MNYIKKLSAVLVFIIGPLIGCAKVEDLPSSGEESTFFEEQLAHYPDSDKKEIQNLLMRMYQLDESTIPGDLKSRYLPLQLFDAAKKGDLLTFLVFRGLKISEKEKRSILKEEIKDLNLLHVAALSGHAPVVEFLLKYSKDLGIDLNLPGHAVSYPLAMSIKNFSLSSMDLLYQNKPAVLNAAIINTEGPANMAVYIVISSLADKESTEDLLDLDRKVVSVLEKLKQLGLKPKDFSLNILTREDGSSIAWDGLHEKYSADGKSVWKRKKVQDKLKELAGIK